MSGLRIFASGIRMVVGWRASAPALGFHHFLFKRSEVILGQEDPDASSFSDCSTPRGGDGAGCRRGDRSRTPRARRRAANARNGRTWRGTLHGAFRLRFPHILGTPNVALDPSRIAAQIVSGIGFLGAGLIIVRRE